MPNCFDRRAISKFVRLHLERKANLGYHLWGLLILFLWMNKWQIQTSPRGDARKYWPTRKLGRLSNRFSDRGRHLSGLRHFSAFPDGRCRRRASANCPEHADLRRLGDRASGRRRRIWKSSPSLLDRLPFFTNCWAFPIGLRGCLTRWPPLHWQCLTAAFGIWAFGRRAGLYAGMCMGTCAGLFLFTRILIPDAMLTFTIALAMWAFLRALDPGGKQSAIVGRNFGVSSGRGTAAEEPGSDRFPGFATALIYLAVTKQLFSRETWKRLHPISGTLIVLLVAVPWHVLATLRNPPYFSFSVHSGPGRISRLPVVFLHERTSVAIPESSLSARLQHRAATLFLVVSPAVAVPLERVHPGNL